MANEENDYLETKDRPSGPDYLHLARAIGRWISKGRPPGLEPVWAFAECERIYQDAQRRVRMSSVPGPTEGRNDATILELVADFYIDKEKRAAYGVNLDRHGNFSEEQAFIAAIRAVGEAGSDGSVTSSQTRKIRRAWRRDAHRRLERAQARWMIKFQERTGFKAGPSRPDPHQ